MGEGGLTQGLEDASYILRGTDGPEVQRQGRVMAHRGLGTLVLQAGAGHPLTHQVFRKSANGFISPKSSTASSTNLGSWSSFISAR